MPKISTLIITYNNANKIKDCLESVKWTDEIVIVDAESNDGTQEIIKPYTDKIYTRRWDSSYAKQRNFGLQYTTGDWILQIDPDERITPKLQTEILATLEKPAQNFYWIPFQTYFLGHPLRHGAWYPCPHLRLFRNNGSHWVRDVHEQVADKEGRIVKREDRDSGFLKNHYLHYSFDTVNHYFEKFIRYIEIDAREMVKIGKDRYGREIKVNLHNSWSLAWFFIYRPLRFFISRYFRHQGYKDGIHGFVYALFGTFYESVTRIKYWQNSSRLLARSDPKERRGNLIKLNNFG
ncbi:MAG: glycosyltransferase family 2 protein [Patescibacteria group bacterium]|nr:glycosyltransferase family 2 protein [Patescibacteria group bacterium]